MTKCKKCKEWSKLANDSQRSFVKSVNDNSLLTEKLLAERNRYKAALQYIVDHDEFSDKPKWGNEFLDVAKEAPNSETH